MNVGQLFLADIGRDINPVIKVADYTQAELQRELEDYVVTDSIEKYLLDFLEHYTDTRQKQTDRVGVWISGYVGSGKSHFAKLLSLLTANPQVTGRMAIDRFRPRLATCRQAREIERHLYEMATFLQTEVIGFQIDAVAIKGQQDDICNILYRQFLAHRGLSTDLKIAWLIEEPLLERGALDVYRQAVQELAGKPWLDNLARLLVSRLDADFSALRSQVEVGLQQLIAARYVAKTGDQYEYLSGERKRIEEEIADEDVRTAHKRDKLKKFLTPANLEVGTIRYEDTFRFDVRVVCDDQVVVSRGGIEVRMISSLKALLDGIRAGDLEAESLATPNTLYWLARPSSEIERLLDRCERLERVVERYEADTSKSPEMEGIVREKRRDLDESLKPALLQELKSGFRQGQFIFRGNAHAADPRMDRLGRLFSAEVSAIIPKVYAHFHKARHVVADERKAIEATLTAAPSRVHQVEAPLGLFDQQGSLNRTSRALDDVYAYLEAEARRGNVVTGKMLVERYEGIPYGWDSNIARVCAAALFRAGTLVFTLEKKDYRDPRDAEATRAFLDSWRFERAELHLESDIELSVEERMLAREQLHVLFGVRPEETPAALAEVIEKQLTDRLAKLRAMAEWVRLTGFPLPPAYAAVTGSFEEIVEERRPNTCLRQFLAHLDTVGEQVRLVDGLYEFFSSPRRDEYERGHTALSALRAAVIDDLATDAMRTALNEYDGRGRDRELLGTWPQVHGFLIAALSDLRDLYGRLHQEADETYRGVVARLADYAAAHGPKSDAHVFGLIEPVKQHVCGEVGGWTPESGYRCSRCQRDLATLIHASLAAQRLEDRLIQQIDEQLASYAPSGDDGRAAVARKVRTIRVAGVVANRRIGDLAAWETVCDQLDRAVRAALADGDEVELR